MLSMALDWLYGPARTWPTTDQVMLRSLTFEIDTILEIVEILRGTGLEVTATQLVIPGRMMPSGPPLDLDKLADTPTWQLNRLYLLASSGPPENVRLEVFLDSSGPAEVRLYVPDPANELPEAADAIARLGGSARIAFPIVADKLENEGRPRPILKPWLLRLPWVGFLMLLGTWCWILADLRPPVSLVIFGSLLLGPAAAAAAWTQTAWRSRMVPAGLAPGQDILIPGCRISSVTRRETRERRATSRAGLKQFAVTAPVAAILGVLGTLVAQRVG